MIRAWRASLLRFDPQDRPEWIDDAVLVADAGRVVAVGSASAVLAAFPGIAPQDCRGLVLAPGFIDLHLHSAQIDVIGAASTGLLDWLERRTFAAERAFADPVHARVAAADFIDELLRHGVTSGLVFCSPHAASVDALFEQAERRDMRIIAGQVLMDRNAPTALCDSADALLSSTESLIRRWHGRGRLGYAITPRFAPTSTPALLDGVAALRRASPGVWLQTHAAETIDECRWVASLFPFARSYLDVYDRAGLLSAGSVVAHCLHIDDRDRQRLRECGAAIAVCPGSNRFLGSGGFDFDAARDLDWGLASDVGAGPSFSPFRTMLAAFETARQQGGTLAADVLWRRHTLDAARALGLQGRIGNLLVGAEADFLLLDPAATPLLGRRTAAARTLEDWLFAMITLADDRAVRQTVIAGIPQLPADRSPARALPH